MSPVKHAIWKELCVFLVWGALKKETPKPTTSSKPGAKACVYGARLLKVLRNSRCEWSLGSGGSSSALEGLRGGGSRVFLIFFPLE